MRIFEPQHGIRNKGFFILFYPFALDLDILFLSSPDFSSILDILFLSCFYPLVLDLDILFLSSFEFSSILDIFLNPFFIIFLSFFILLYLQKPILIHFAARRIKKDKKRIEK